MKRNLYMTGLAALTGALLAGSAFAEEKLIYATVSPAGGASGRGYVVTPRGYGRRASTVRSRRHAAGRVATPARTV